MVKRSLTSWGSEMRMGLVVVMEAALFEWLCVLELRESQDIGLDMEGRRGVRVGGEEGCMFE